MDAAERLRPFVAGFVVDWLQETPAERHRSATGTLVFVDISGFTRLTERLAAKGKIGAEEMSGLLDSTFAALLAVAYDYGAWLVKWGGDAVLLLFEGDGHVDRACTAAFEMRRTMREVGRLRTSVGQVTLRMSMGIHTGAFDFFLVGSRHHELVITGSAATTTVDMETLAEAGEIMLSPATAAFLAPRAVGVPKARGFLLRRSPGAIPQLQVRSRDLTGLDLATCLPAVTRDHLLAGGTDGEHRLVTVGFVEFAGTDAILADVGPAAAADAVEHVIRACQEAAERHQVTFWETDVGTNGGKVMLVSGAPRSAGHDEDRMLASVREIVDAGGALQLRAGVNCGRVYAGEFGPSFRRTYSVKGDAVNLAARLMSNAGAGEVFAADEVMSRARTSYATETLAPLMVKGKARPVSVQRVKQALGATAATPRVELPFAGRESELAGLLTGLTDARAGSGQAWELSGEAGIGKSRLVTELIVRTDAATVVRVACDQYHSMTPYAIFRRALRQLLGLADDADPAVAGVALLDVVEREAPSLTRWTPLLAAVLDAQVPRTPESDAVEARFRKTSQEEQTVRLLAALVPGTMVLAIEDTHLMDDASLDLLRQLTARAPDHPWLIVTTRRPNPDGAPVLDTDGVRHLELRPLPLETVDALVKRATEDRPLPPHEASLLIERAGGNPLFVQELLGATRGVGGVSALPDTVEGVIAVQIDRLPPLDRRVLRIASVLGVRIERPVLAQILLADGVDPAGAFERLAGFVDNDGADALRFRHTLARDTAYEGLPFSRRQLLHGLAGEVIEQLAGTRADDEAGLLSLHFLEARRFEAAWRYARIAGEHAQEVHAQVEAAEFYERALDAAKRLGPAVSGEVAAVAEALGDARYKLGAFAEAAGAYRSARAASAHAVDHARLCYKSSLVADRVGQLGNALRWLTRARRLLSASSDGGAVQLRAQCSAQYGLIRHWQGRDVDAIVSLREAVELAEQADADDALATALVWLDNCEMTLGQSGTGEHARRALEIWRRLGNRPWEEARVLNQLGIRAYFEGRWDLAVEHYAQSRQACDRAGDQFTGAVESGNMAEVLSDQGRLTEAEPLLRDAMRVWRAAAAPSFIAFGKSQIGRLAARSGRFDEAVELLNSARDDYLRDGEHGEVLESEARLAECLLLQGADAAALAAADDTLARVSSLPGVLPQLPLLLRIRGVALAQLGDPTNALVTLEVSLQDAHERRARHEVAWTMHAMLEVRKAWGLPPDVALAAERASLFDQLGIVAVAEPVLKAPPTEQPTTRIGRQRTPGSVGAAEVAEAGAVEAPAG